MRKQNKEVKGISGTITIYCDCGKETEIFTWYEITKNFTAKCKCGKEHLVKIEK